MPGRVAVAQGGDEVPGLGLAPPYADNLAKSLYLLSPRLPHDPTLVLCTWHGQPELAETLQPHWC